jgi:hypothetical protein
MYPVYSVASTDLFNIYCWVFASIWRADIPDCVPAVPMDSWLGLHRDLWDMAHHIRNRKDQTHHFAAYFWFGARYGAAPPVVMLALERSGDVVSRNWGYAGALNTGDVLLGLLAAQWGVVMKESPDYLGHRVAQSLRTCGNWPCGVPQELLIRLRRRAQTAG